MSIDVRVLRNFLSVVTHRSIGRAAAAVHVTQSALTKSIQRLEAELGVKLFERTATGTEPTAFGEALIEHANLVVRNIDRLSKHMVDLSEGHSGHIMVGAGSGILESLVARATTQLCSSLPGVRVTAIAGLADSLLPRLMAGELDLVIGVRSALFLEPRVLCTPLFKDTIGVVARKAHPLMRRQNLALCDIQDARWALPPASHTFTNSCMACFAAAGLPGPVPSVVSESVPFLDSLVCTSDFLTFMPLSLLNARGRRNHLLQLSVTGGTWSREAFLFQRSDVATSPVLTAFVQSLQQAASV